MTLQRLATYRVHSFAFSLGLAVSSTIATAVVAATGPTPILGDPVAHVVGAARLPVRADAAPTVRVIRPNGGEAFVQNEQETVSWETSGATTVDVFVSRDGGATYTSLGLNLYDIGYSFWKSEGALTTQALIKVIAHNAQGQTAEDVSDGLFAIVTDAGRIATACTLVVTPPQTTCGEGVLLAADVTPSAATGVVSFYRNGLSLGSAHLDAAGHAELRLNSLPVGDQSFVARYEGDVAYARSNSEAVVHPVNASGTTTTLQATPSPANCGAPVQISAVVMPSTAAGYVRFREGLVVLATVPLTSGQAVFTTSSLAVATHQLSADYLGEFCYQASTSNVVSLVVQKVPTTTTLAANRVNCGAHLVASVSQPNSGGIVTFYDGSVLLLTVPLAGSQAVLDVSTFTAGDHPLSANFSGGGCYLGSVSGTVTLNFAATVTTTQLVVIPSPSDCGNTVTLRVTVTPAGGTGNVVFKEGTATIGNIGISIGGLAEITIRPLSVGTHTYSASYPGGACFGASASPDVAHQVNRNAATTATVVASPNPAKLGDRVTLTATVQPSQATGTAEFFEGGFSLGTASFVNGVATLMVTPSQGAHTVRAVFSGDACFFGATSPPINYAVGDPPRVSIQDAQGLEGQSGTGQILFVVALSSRSTVGVAVNYRTEDGTAHSDSDYVASSGTVVIPAGLLTTLLSIPIRGDVSPEANETFNVILSAPVIAVLDDSVATGTIQDDDHGPGPPPGLTEVGANEGDAGQKPFVFLFISPVLGPASFSYTTVDGTALVANGDYVAASGTLNVPTGSTRATITVMVNGDSTYESDERFTLVVSSPGGDTYAAFGIIFNDDTPPRVAIDDLSTLETNAGSYVALVHVRMDRMSNSPVFVSFRTRDGSATVADHDYESNTGTISISPKTRVGLIPITIFGDGLIEPNEYFSVELTLVTGASVDDANAFVTILADDAGTPPTVRLTHPNGGEAMRLATQEKVSWVSSTNVTVDVLLSRDGGGTFESLGQDFYDIGYAYWKVEGGLTNNAIMKVRVRDFIGRVVEDVSDAPFSVVSNDAQEPPGPTLVGVFEAKAVAQGVELRWQLGDTPKTEAVRLERRRSDAGDWATIAPQTREESGTHVAIDADVTPGATYRYLLAARLEGGAEVRFESPPVAFLAASGERAWRIVPNPTRGPTRIEFAIARAGPVRVTVVDVQGREVAALGAGWFAAGVHRIDWDGESTRGAVPAGLYFVRGDVAGARIERRFVVVR